MLTLAVANCRPAVTCPVSGVLPSATKGSEMAFLVSLTLSSSSIAARRPIPRTLAGAREIAKQRLAIFSWSRFSFVAAAMCGTDQSGFSSRSSAVGDSEFTAQRIIVTPSALA
jgi:hypothetical protein